jgi:hypothetical protein
MFSSASLDKHLKTTDVIKTKSVVIAEWNMNNPDNIKRLGNYRYRPSNTSSPYYLLPSTYQEIETGPLFYYTGATDSDIAIESGLNEDDQPTMFVSPQTKMKMLFSLEECVKPFRPRSGINKLLYLGGNSSSSASNQYIDDPRADAARRPRYYMASKDDQFKYWTSFRKELGIPTPLPGISFPQVEQQVVRGVSFFYPGQNINYIEDAVPFVVYDQEIPTNKIVVKMQTNIGEVSIGSARYDNSVNIDDPLYGDANKTTPVRWRIEVLKNNAWVAASSFDETSTKPDGSPLIGPDGYVEISYGLIVPDEYKENFYLVDELPNSSILPDYAMPGDAYLVKGTEQEKGTIYVWNEEEWQSFDPDYTWGISAEGLYTNSNLISKLSNPDFYVENNTNIFREFDIISGIRIVVETMNRSNCTFDLIEMSPRLVADLTETVVSFSVSKKLSDLGNSSIPVGDLFASTGSIDILDVDFSFNENNIFNKENGTGSIVYNHLSEMVKFVFYEQVLDANNLDYYIPLKTMYSFGFPQASSVAASLSLELRDFFFYLEYAKAPQLLLTDVSLSYAIMTLLDFVGFDNYVFKRIFNKPELIIPYFFVQPGQNVAEVLKELAVASQSAMFFDEYNNLVVMSKEYLLPSEEERATDSSLTGQETIIDNQGNSYFYLGEIYDESELPEEKYNGAFLNYTNNKLYVWNETSQDWQEGNSLDRINQPNIVAFSSKEKKVYNDGQINYTTRYLQRSLGFTEVMPMIDKYKNFIYKPVLLWEVAARQNRQTINELSSQMGGYTLGAIPLNSDLTSQPPSVVANTLLNNIIDVGENVYWMTSYQGYLYANGEIIKYDAIEYIVSGEASPVWITNNQQYQEYFGKLKFNGKMYPSGRIRIYSEPEFEAVGGQLIMRDASPVKIHGRGQFGTPIVSHSAGLDTDNYWKNSTYVRGCYQHADSYLFNVSDYISYPAPLTNSASGINLPQGVPGYSLSTALAQKSSRSGIINNALANKSFTETELSYKKTTDPGTVQSSALVFTGPEIPNTMPAGNFVSYIYKDFVDENGAAIPYKHYGTRMRVVGKIESGTNKSQSPSGLFPIFTGSGSDSPSSTTNTNDQEVIIHGGSGGLAFNINKDTNTGYYFEIAALTVDNLDQYISDNNPGRVSAEIISSPAPSCVSGVVSVWTKDEITWEVGQKVIISGLVDAANPTNTLTPLNGEYTITAIGSNKKQFQYNIGTSLTTTSQTGGLATVDLATNTNFANMFFYKVVADASGNAVPYKLWSGLSKINVDSGEFIGQARLVGEDNTTVYDLAAEYVNTGTSRKFFLYVNNKQVAIVEDSIPLTERNSMALFVRGSSKCMFENIYALSHNYSQNSVFPVVSPVSEVFGDEQIDVNEAFRKYALSGMIQKTYLSGISSLQDPSFKIYFEEFGTILREAAYFNILYDRAFPALMAKLDKTNNNIKGYSTSGFYAWSYGAEFLIFNCTDFALNLDDTSGNYLRIIGNTFTQSTSYTLTVDDLYKKRENLLDTALEKETTLYNPLLVSQEYNKILNSRTKHGKNEITIDSPFIQSDAAAEDIFSWLISKTFVPKKVIGVNVFGIENLQLGDIVTVKYTSNEGIDVISDQDTRYVIYQIDYSKQEQGPSTVVYLVEV